MSLWHQSLQRSHMQVFYCNSLLQDMKNLPCTKNSHFTSDGGISATCGTLSSRANLLQQEVSLNTLVFFVVFKVQNLHPWRPIHPNAIGTAWTWSWTTWPACCLSPRRSEVAWTNSLCYGSVWDTSRLRVTSMVSDTPPPHLNGYVEMVVWVCVCCSVSGEHTCCSRHFCGFALSVWGCQRGNLTPGIMNRSPSGRDTGECAAGQMDSGQSNIRWRVWNSESLF